MKKNVLIFISHYLPGYKSGGPLRTIENLVRYLSDDYNFFILTSDRDSGDNEAYDSVSINSWNSVGNAKVFYTGKVESWVVLYNKIIKEVEPDVIYLNSFFDFRYSIFFLFASIFRRVSLEKPILLAPRGEFSEGAMSIKKVKKMLFLMFSKLIGLHKNIIFHASSKYEKEDIIRVFGKRAKKIIRVASDLPSAWKVLPKGKVGIKTINPRLKIIFLSRISKMKNLDYALRVLSKLVCKVDFSIYGPIEDEVYWEHCKTVMQEVPDNVRISYKGLLQHNEIFQKFSEADLFLFPSMGENYGHVIAESLLAGTLVLTSDNTPWRDLAQDGLGWDVPLGSMSIFVEIIEDLANKTNDERQRLKEHTFHKAKSIVLRSDDIQANKDIFIF